MLKNNLISLLFSLKVVLLIFLFCSFTNYEPWYQKCLLKMIFIFTLKKCQAKLVSVRLNEMKFCARTLALVFNPWKFNTISKICINLHINKPVANKFYFVLKSQNRTKINLILFRVATLPGNLEKPGIWQFRQKRKNWKNLELLTIFSC